MAFSSIPSTYTDLCLKVTTRTDRSAAGDWVNISYNGSTSSFTARVLAGDGSSAYSYTDTRLIASTNAVSTTSNTFGSMDYYIPNYTSSNYKSASSDAVSENNGTAAYENLVANLWSNTAAITSITLTSGAGANFVQYSTATLYGIKNS